MMATAPPPVRAVSANAALLFSPVGHEFRYHRKPETPNSLSLRSAPMAHERTARLADSPPMFESRFLDFFSRVHPAIPAILFVPAVVGGVWLGIDRGLSAGPSVLLFIAGLGIWTLTEYWLHRLFFHWE